jgi:hypothetical protein
MNTTLKALIVGTVIATTGLVAVASLPPAVPVYKLDSVVVTAKRLPVERDVIRLATVEVTASRADVMAAQAEENSKQAAAASNPRI